MTSKDEDLLSAWAELFVSHALAVRSIEREIAGRAPLSLDEYDVLLVVSRSPGTKLRLSQLADATVYTRSGITRIVRRLEGAGYLRRQECPEDKRGSLAVLTDEGRRALRESWKHYSAAILKVMDPCFSRADAQQLQRLLSKLAGHLSSDNLVHIRTRITH